MDIDSIKKLVIKAGLKLAETGLIARTWGNVSCRIDDNFFAVTPSGMSYQSLTPDDIVIVNIKDCSYIGNVKPSSEKGIHAAVYELFPDINFVIHTHQENASVISATCLNSIKIDEDNSYLGNEVICASYALPGTDELKNNIIEAMKRSDGKAVIMKNHGVLCLGRNYDEAFMVATKLENYCSSLIKKQYIKLSGESEFSPDDMNRFSIALNNKIYTPYDFITHKNYCNSNRTKYGFEMYCADGSKFEVLFDRIDDSLPTEALLYNAIYKNNSSINFIRFRNSSEITAISRSGMELRPVLDDFAQIAGTAAANVDDNVIEILRALKNSSVVLLRSGGALCFGKTEGDATAVGIVTQKACKAYLGASLFGEVVAINPAECRLMRYNYVNTYSKLNK